MRTLVLFGWRVRVERLLELVKYTSGCGCSVLVKMLVTMIFSLCHAPVWMAYLGAQVVIVFFFLWIPLANHVSGRTLQLVYILAVLPFPAAVQTA